MGTTNNNPGQTHDYTHKDTNNSSNYQPIKRELNYIQAISAEQMKFKAEITEDKFKYKNHILDLSLPTNEPKFFFNIGNIPTIPQSELVGIKGRAKMGKSQLEYYLIAVMLSGVSRGQVKPLQSQYKVLLFDTEQSQVSLKKCCQRALKFAGLPTDKNEVRFLPFFMRPLTIEERRKTIEDAVREEEPNIIFIDGVRDLLQDFNNLDQSNDLIQWLLQLTAEYGCTIVSVLHQNKAKEDGNMRGHLGTELLNKLTDCFEVSKKDGKFIVTCTDSRNVPCSDFAFSIDAEGNFQPEEASSGDKSSARAAEIQRVLKLCFKDKASMRYGELVEAYHLEAAVTDRTAKTHIKEAKDNDFISVQNGLYSLSPK